MSFSPVIPSPSLLISSVSVESLSNYLASQKTGLIAEHFNIAGLIFHYSGEVKTELNADITDHYTEDLKAVHDHIALQPIRVVMRGLIGELSRGFSPSGISGSLQTLQNGLTSVPGYLGKSTPQAVYRASKVVSQAQNVSNQVSSAVSKGKSLYKFFRDGAVSNTEQSRFYIQLEALWNQRAPFTIQTPHKIYRNMVIESMVALQPEDTKYLSEFTVTLKQIRFASVTTINAVKTSGVTQWNQQRTELKNNGVNTGSKLSLTTPTTTGLNRMKF